MLYTIRQDLSRIAKPTLFNALKGYFIPRCECFDFIVWLRILQWMRQQNHTHLFLITWPLSFAVYLIYRHFEFKYGIHPNANIEIGPGFRPVHGPCHLNATRIGSNFTVYPGVTIGINKGGVPTIGNNVTIYTNAVVCGPITLQDGAIVRALEYLGHDR